MEYPLIFKPCLPLTPVGFGERVANMYRGRLFYMADTKTWLHWNGNKFVQCGDEILLKLIKNCIENLPLELRKNQLGKANNKIITQNDLINAAEINLTTGKMKETIKILSTIDGVIAANEDFDTNPAEINCKNGVIDMLTGEIRPSNPSNLVKQAISVNYNKFATCSTFDQFVLDICNNDKELVHYFQVFSGYLFTGLTTEQQLFVLFGLGANGKSLLISVLLNIAGDYGMSTPASTLLAGRAGAIRNDYARLVNSRIVAATETSRGHRFDEAGVKMLTGEDMIVSRKLYREFFEYVPKFKVVLSVNNLPRIFGNDKGIKRRICIIPFRRTFEKRNCDKQLKQKLLLEAEGIFAWIIQGAGIYLENGLPECKTVAEATSKYLDEMDEIQNFLTDCCKVELQYSKKRIPVAALYSKYQTWANINGIDPIGKYIFGDSIKAKGLTQVKSGGVRYWHGISILI